MKRKCPVCDNELEFWEEERRVDDNGPVRMGCRKCGYSNRPLRSHSMKCPECGSERNCLSCRDVKCTAYSVICLKDHYGVTVGEGCEEWRCKCGHEEKVGLGEPTDDERAMGVEGSERFP